MYENGKMTPVETLPEMGRDGLKENNGGDESKYIVRTCIHATMYL
jgi:hypothetical protein